MTDRINVVKTSPSTRFVLEADLLSQDVATNASVIRCYLRANNGPSGTTGSQFNATGFQAGSIDGVGEFGRRTANPFLPSGFNQNEQRWRIGPFDVTVPHNADGTKTAVLRMSLDYGSIDEDHTASLALPRIQRGPRVRVSGTWKPSVAYVRVGGVWKVAIPYVKVSGVWKVAGS